MTGPEFEYTVFWWETTEDALSSRSLYKLFRSDEFATLASEAVRRSARYNENQRGAPEFTFQEFGLLAYRRFLDDNIYLSKLIEGEERSISADAYYNFPKSDADVNSDEEHIDELLSLHTHPTDPVLSGLLPALGSEKYLPPKGFSLGDLKVFKQRTQYQPHLIYGVGYERIAYSLIWGDLLFISFGNFNNWKNFDPEATYKQSLPLLKSRDWPLSAYESAGLNVASIRIRLGDKPKVVVQDALRASRILGAKGQE